MKIASFILVLSLVTLAGCADKSSPNAKGGSADNSTSQSGKQFDPSKPEFTFNPADWSAEFKKDSKSARSKYEGKVIQVKGKIKSFLEEGPRGNFVTSIFFDLGKNNFGLLRAIVDEPTAWTKYSIGSTVTVTGVFLAKMPFGPFDSMDGDLFHCDVKLDSGEPTPVVTIDTLFKEFEANPDEFEKKYDGKEFIVEGVVAMNKKIKDVYELRFKGPKWDVMCDWSNEDFAIWRGVDKVKPGDKVQVYAKLSVPNKSILLQFAKFMGSAK